MTYNKQPTYVGCFFYAPTLHYIHMKKLYKSKNDKVLTGMLGGLATYLGVDSTVLRVIFMILLVFTGFFPFGIIYIAAYFLIPNMPPHNTVSEQ